MVSHAALSEEEKTKRMKRAHLRLFDSFSYQREMSGEGELQSNTIPHNANDVVQG